MAGGDVTSLLPYFIASLMALAGVLGVLYWSGALQFQKWQIKDGRMAVGDYDNIPGITKQEDCFKLCNNAYVAGSFTDVLGAGNNCQLFRSVACGYDNTQSHTKYNPKTLNNDFTVVECVKK